MKKYLMKGVSLFAVSVMFVGCSHDAWFQTNDRVRQMAEEYSSNFKTIVLGGQDVDARQTWNTAVSTKVNVSVVKAGTLKIYSENPFGNIVAPLYEATVSEGQAVTAVIARPQNVSTLYAAVLDSEGYIIDNMSFDASEEEATVKFYKSQTTDNASARRTIQPSFKFPGDATANKFKDDVPTGVEKLTQNIGRANNYIDQTWEGDLNIWGAATAEGNWQDRSGGVLYVKGYCDFSNRSFYFDGNSELYLVKGATLILGENNGSGNLQVNTNIYIAEGAKLIAKGELKLNNGLHIFNHGTIETDKLSTNSESWLVNGGTVTVKTKISVENTLSVIENNGTITAADLNTAGSGKIENNKDVTISGTTFVNSNDNTWVNNGHYHTGNFIYNAASDDVINNCKMIVDEDFNINLGDNPGNGNFKMDAGSSVVTKYFNGGGNWAKNYSTGWSAFNGGPFYIYMGAGSMFDVTETATMNATKANYGVYGPSEGNFAVFRAKRIVAGTAGQGYEVTYGGNLYVATDDHFSQGWSGSYPYIDIKGAAALTAYSGAKAQLSNAGCGAAYAGVPDEEERPETPQSFRYCFEDNFPDAGDYDFNDVVLTVTPTLSDKTLTIKVSLDAVGATKNIGAAMRLIGVKSSDLVSCTVSNPFPSPEGLGLGDYTNIDTGETFLAEGQSPNNTQNMVVVFFKDAHWAINPQKTSTGTVERIFFNTVEAGDYYERNVDVKTATYTLVFKDADKANEMLAENLYDVFIVEPYGGGYWEVHTVQNGFKTAQVVTPLKPDGAAYDKAYGNNMPWAIMVPGDFKYPIEWHSIGSNKNGELSGAYKTPGHAFAEWAADSEKATDWYLYPDEELVFK